MLQAHDRQPVIIGLPRGQTGIEALFDLLETAIGMALEAVDLDTGKGMTFGAEVLRILVAHDRLRARRIVAVHAAGQAVLAAAFAVDNRFVALVHQEVHVFATHDLDRLDAVLRRRGFCR